MKYVAFLRGINVGGHKPVKMEDLKQAFVTAGFRNVRTVLASGNVVFEIPEISRATVALTIERELRRHFGYEIGVQLRPLDEIRQIVEAGPFRDVTVTPDTRCYVTFISGTPRGTLGIPCELPEKGFTILSRTAGEVFSVLVLSPGTSTTDAMNILKKEFGKNITTRNWNTVLRLVESRLGN